MLIGPRLHEGTDGYLVVTPLERDGNGTTVLVNRGWISKKFKKQSLRPEGLPKGEVTVEGLLREPWKKNMFTPVNNPEKGEFYFPDVVEMATVSGSQAVWVEETMGTSSINLYARAIEVANTDRTRFDHFMGQRIQGNTNRKSRRGQFAE